VTELMIGLYMLSIVVSIVATNHYAEPDNWPEYFMTTVVAFLPIGNIAIALFAWLLFRKD